MKYRLIIGAAGLAALALSGQASANPAGSLYCGPATIIQPGLVAPYAVAQVEFKNYPAQPVTQMADVYSGGQIVNGVLEGGTRIGGTRVTFMGPSSGIVSFGVPLTAYGAQYLTLISTRVGPGFGTPTLLDHFEGPCNAPETGPTPAPQPEGEQTPIKTVRVPLTCPELRARKAGRNSLIARGCKVPVTRKPPRFKCPAYDVTKVWQRILRERHGVICPAVPSDRPVTPAVAGER